MGWTTTNWTRGTTIVEFMKDQWEYEDERHTNKVLDAALVQRKHAYAAVERISKDTGEHIVFAATYLIGFQKGYYNFAYKDMTEFYGPSMYDCPERILKLLTPIEKPENDDCGDAWARKWRADNWKTIRNRKAKNKKRRKWNKGDVVIFTTPLTFTGGRKFKSLEVLSTKPLRFTDGNNSIFGSAQFKIRKATLDYFVKEVIPASQEKPEEVIREYDVKDYPLYVDDYSNEHRIIGWACGLPKTNWEWYATEVDDKEEKIYYGFVMGFENEWGTFSVKELNECGIQFITNPEELKELMPPPGWKKVA